MGELRLTDLGVEREFCHELSKCCQVSIIVHGGQEIQELESTHKGLWGRSIDVVKVNKILWLI